MKHTIPLRQVAAARAGDKGNVSSISVWPYDPRHYDDLKESLTAEIVKQAFPHLFKGAVERYEMDELKGFNFVMRDALEGGVNSSLGLPPEKWSSLMYGLWPDGGLKNAKEETHG